MSTLPSGLPDIVDDQEFVSRLLTSSSWFAASKNFVKPAAFLPAPDHDTSVLRSALLSKGDLWKMAPSLGLKQPDGTSKPIYGAGTVKVQTVRGLGLDVTAQEPPLFHANLRGWPVDENEELRKARRKDLANALSAEAILSLSVDPPEAHPAVNVPR